MVANMFLELIRRTQLPLQSGLHPTTFVLEDRRDHCAMEIE
jgi:hypothetical protein